jgi:hypothetical protein
MTPGFFLGGTLAPIGLAVSFLRRPLEAVRDELLAWRAGLGQRLEERGPVAFPACVDLIDRFEMPWTTELLIASGAWAGEQAPREAARACSRRHRCRTESCLRF